MPADPTGPGLFIRISGQFYEKFKRALSTALLLSIGQPHVGEPGRLMTDGSFIYGVQTRTKPMRNLLPCTTLLSYLLPVQILTCYEKAGFQREIHNLLGYIRNLLNVLRKTDKHLTLTFRQ